MDKELSSRELEAQADALLAEAGEVEEIPMEKLPVRSKKAAAISRTAILFICFICTSLRNMVMVV